MAEHGEADDSPRAGMAVTLAGYAPAWPLAFAEQRDRPAVLPAP
ncbi:hypothetical protein [Streptomyces liangshanensis]